MLRFLFFLSLFLFSTCWGSPTSPHIIFVLIDDLGWADFSYNNPAETIPTPHIDQLSSQGVRLTNHYVHPTCTPSRASLLTGRYATNTGLIFAMAPGAIVGLPDDVPTLPQMLKKYGGYDTHMVGKWHLGHSKWKQTPVGKGFDSHTGCFMWDIDSYTKEFAFRPTQPLAVDWIESYANRSYRHYQVHRHATIEITEGAQAKIRTHSETTRDKPMFLYVAYTAAHSPLQPVPEHVEKCSHIVHKWRRDYCGMVVGVDEGIHNITTTAKQYLGDNVIVVVTSDNGGSTWFGGGNAPFRSGKTTPFEGGVHVPAFAVDFTPQGRYLNPEGGKYYHGLFHISDWAPTLLSYATHGKTNEIEELKNIDGVDASIAIRNNFGSPRKGLLLDLYDPENFLFNESISAYLHGEWKLIEGNPRDTNWYYESSQDRINSTLFMGDKMTDEWLVARIGEMYIRLCEWVIGVGRFDSGRVSLTHMVIHARFIREKQTFLFNVREDPEERNNLAEKHPEIVQEIRELIRPIKAARPPQAKFWMQIPLLTDWPATLVPGTCESAVNCSFTHPWLADDVDESTVRLVDMAEVGHTDIRRFIIATVVIAFSLISTPFLCIYCILCRTCASGRKRKQKQN